MIPSHHAKATEKKALLIGIEYLGSLDKDVQPLPGIRSDLEKAKHFLVTSWNYREEDVVLMSESCSDPQANSPANHTHYLLQIREMEALVADARPGDYRTLMFAGHSIQIKDVNFDEADGLDEALVPLDHRGIKGKADRVLDPEDPDDKEKVEAVICDDDMRKILVDPLRRGVKLFALFDSCTSGTLLDLKHYCGSKPAASKLPRKFAGVLKKPKRRVTCVADGTDMERPRRRDTFPFPTRRSSVDWLLNRTSRLCSAAQFDDAAPKSVVSIACTEDSQAAYTAPGMSLIPVFISLAEEPETRKYTWKQIFKTLHYRMRGLRLVMFAKHLRSTHRPFTDERIKLVTDMFEPQIGADSRSTLHRPFCL